MRVVGFGLPSSRRALISLTGGSIICPRIGPTPQTADGRVGSVERLVPSCAWRAARGEVPPNNQLKRSVNSRLRRLLPPGGVLERPLYSRVTVATIGALEFNSRVRRRADQ